MLAVAGTSNGARKPKLRNEKDPKPPITSTLPCKLLSELVSLLMAGNLSEFFLGYSRSESLQAFKNLCNILCIHDFSFWFPDQSLDLYKTFAVQMITC